MTANEYVCKAVKRPGMYVKINEGGYFDSKAMTDKVLDLLHSQNLPNKTDFTRNRFMVLSLK